MCSFASMVLTKNDIFWDNTDSHARIIQKNNLMEMVANRVILVRVELIPPNLRVDAPLDEWEFSMNQDILPEWYERSKVEERARRILPEIISKRVFSHQGTYEIGEGSYFALNNVVVRIFGEASLHAYHDASVYAYDNTYVTLHDRSEAHAYNRASINALDRSRVTAFNSCNVNASMESRVSASGCGLYVYARDSSIIRANEDSIVHAGGKANVIVCDHAQVYAVNSAIVDAKDFSIVHLRGDAVARAHDDSVVIQYGGEVHLYDNAGCIDRRS